jgi:hypothetical protein
MKTLFPIAALLFAFAAKLYVSQTPPQTPLQSATGVIEGIITRAGTTEPIPGVAMQLISRSTPNPTSFDTFTDEAGHFTFKDLLAGQYQMRYTLAGYFNSPDGVQSNATLNSGGRGTATAFLLFTLDTKQPAQFAIAMIPGGVISGRVSDSNGRPIISGLMTALQVTYQDGLRTLSSAKTSMTNDRGEFRIFGLEPGEYYVRCEYPVTSGAAGGSRDTLRAYFPGVFEPNSASPVRVRSGAETGGTNIATRPGNAVTVSGTVVLPPSLTGNPQTDVPLGARGNNIGFGAASATFYLISLEGGLRDGTQAIPNALTGTADRSAGKFEIHNVRPGRYDLYTMIRTNPADAQEQHVGHASITVGNQDVTGVNIPIEPGVDLKVRFTGNDPAAVSQAPLQLRVVMRNGAPAAAQRGAGGFGPAANRGGARGGSSSDWRVYSGMIEGSYSLESQLALLRDAYIADIKQGDRSIYETGTVVIGNITPDPVELILARPAGSIDGTVVNASGKPASGASVVLIPNGDRRQNHLLYKRGTTNDSGKVTLGALAPDAYKLFAWENLPNGAELNADFMKDFEERGVPVTIEAGAQLKVQVPLIPAGSP